MPRVTRWMLKTSLVYFFIALVVGLLQSSAPLLETGSVVTVIRRLEPIRIHLFVIGWLTLFIFGVAIWMFPKFNQAKPRGFAWLGWAAYAFINIGLIFRAIGESAAEPGGVYGWVLVASAIFLWLAGLAFMINTWPRIKEK